MCGICGQYKFKTQGPVLQETLKGMADSMVHRGPDDEGFFMDGCLGFGFRRLSIIDLSTGHQPMSTRDGKITLVFNGEIFNYRELRTELVGKGHSFRTTSDTEVILYAYAEWGMDFLRRLNGMFGLAVWDSGARRLVVARDRFGIKGVYYRIDSEGLTFASEMRAIVHALGGAPGVDVSAIKLFLKYRYAPAPHTPLAGIRKLAAGTCLVVEGGKESLIRWYKRDSRKLASGIGAAEAAEELKRLYRNAVRSHLIADVPVGLLLSGGVDSTLLLALMNECGSDWRTYTVGFGESYKDDELEYAKQTAERFGSLHESVRLSRRDFEELLPKVVSYLEEPVTSASIVPMFSVCAKAREGVKVALVGQGPDEVWGGYKRHIGLRYADSWRRLPAPLREAAGAVLGRASRSETIRRGVYALQEADRPRRFERVFSLASEDEISALFQAGPEDIDAGEAMLACWADLIPEMEGMDEMGAFQLLETRFSLPDELLMYTDKMSMAHSIELRVPYLDKDIVEFAEALPQNLKIRGKDRKYLHRRVARDFVPADVISRKKRAFASNVVDDWFDGSLEGKLSDYLDDPSSRIYAFLDRKPVGAMLAAHRERRSDYHKLLFSLVVLEEWLRSLEGLR
jgi:asparagine synthase (glutamine-hydrolysing)